MKKINGATKVIAKILEVFYWITAGVMALATIWILVAPTWVENVIEPGSDTGTVFIYGLQLTVNFSIDGLNIRGFSLTTIGEMLTLCCMAMIFRNIYLIIKHSEGTSPFQGDNIQRLRRIGAFSISMPIIKLIATTITPLAMGSYHIEPKLQLDGFIMGFIVLSLTQIFTYGAQLERDVDGLL